MEGRQRYSLQFASQWETQLGTEATDSMTISYTGLHVGGGLITRVKMFIYLSNLVLQ